VNYDIVNNSWGIDPPFTDSFFTNANYAAAYQNAASNGRGGLGTIMVFAGGNNRAILRNTNDLNETNNDFGITVGGINATTDLGSLVISGQPFSTPGVSILVSAPRTTSPQPASISPINMASSSARAIRRRRARRSQRRSCQGSRR